MSQDQGSPQLTVEKRRGVLPAAEGEEGTAESNASSTSGPTDGRIPDPEMEEQGGPGSRWALNTSPSSRLCPWDSPGRDNGYLFFSVTNGGAET